MIYLIGKPNRSPKSTVSMQKHGIYPVEAFYEADTNPEIGCIKSHLSALRAFLATDKTHLVIFEDDALVGSNVEWMNYKQYDLFIPFCDNRKFVPEDVEVLEGVLPRWGAFAYVVSRKLAQAVVDFYEKEGFVKEYDVILFQLAREMSFASAKGNLVNHDNFLPSTISEKRRKAYLSRLYVEYLAYIVPNYNNEKYLEEFLNSLYKQTDPNWLAFIGDDASTDGSREILDKITDPRIIVFKYNKNVGTRKLVNLLMKESTSEWCAIADPDDVLHRDNCYYVRKKIKEVSSQKVSLIYSNFYYCDSSLRVRYKGFSRHIPRFKTVLTSDCVSHIKVFNKKYFFQAGGLEEGFVLAEDKDIVFKMEELAACVHIPYALYFYRVRAGSLSDSLKDRKDFYLNAARNAAVIRRLKMSFYQRLLIPLRHMLVNYKFNEMLNYFGLPYLWKRTKFFVRNK